MKKLLFLFLCAMTSVALSAQRLGVYSVAFYNVENLFDTEDDTTNRGDNDFLPTGSYQWTPEKYAQKIHNIASTIAQMAREHCPVGPAAIGLSEVENARVVEDLCNAPELKHLGLKYIHYDSPDRRGIDCALIYNPRLFKPTFSMPYKYRLESNPNFRSRDQLLVSGVMAGEPVSIIVNHWPSRYGGGKSSPLREAAAALTKHIGDSIQAADPRNKVIIIGDLNDDPKNISCAKVLGATRKASDTKEGGYFNATWQFYDKGIGTLYYQDKPNLFDQQIVSANLLGTDRSTLKFWKAEVFNRDFLITKTGKRKGYPLRSFDGNVWQNGYADHFPTISYFVKEIK